MSEWMTHKGRAGPLLLPGKSQIEQQQWKRSYRQSVCYSGKQCWYETIPKCDAFTVDWNKQKTSVDTFLLFMNLLAHHFSIQEKYIYQRTCVDQQEVTSFIPAVFWGSSPYTVLVQNPIRAPLGLRYGRELAHRSWRHSVVITEALLVKTYTA